MTWDVTWQRSTWIGSDGREWAHLPTVMAHEFGVSRSEARRLLAMGGVELDGEIYERVDAPVSDLRGRELRVGRRVATL